MFCSKKRIKRRQESSMNHRGCCCKSKDKMGSKKSATILKDQHIYKEGFMEKKTGFFKVWKARYFVLLEDVLCYFLREEQKETYKPVGRIFFSDTTSIDRADKKPRPYAILIRTETKKYVMSCTSYAEREDWVNKIWEAKEKHKNLENSDPVRRQSTRLGKDFKRITIQKDPQHGIGCTIKNVGGAIFVSRIIPDGPVATSGVLRPGDQIMDINGTRVTQCPIEKIKEVIRSSPDYVVCTVKPVTHYTSHDESPLLGRTPYTEVDPELLAEDVGHDETNYMRVQITDQEVYSDDEGRASSTALDSPRSKSPFLPSGHEDYMNSEMFQYEEHDKVEKKLTNYAELEFRAR